MRMSVNSVLADEAESQTPGPKTQTVCLQMRLNMSEAKHEASNARLELKVGTRLPWKP